MNVDRLRKLQQALENHKDTDKFHFDISTWQKFIYLSSDIVLECGCAANITSKIFDDFDSTVFTYHSLEEFFDLSQDSVRYIFSPWPKHVKTIRGEKAAKECAERIQQVIDGR